MLLFCPLCMNILTATRMPEGGNRLRMECRTCPYEHPIEQKIFSRRSFWKRKEEDDAVKKLLEKAKAERGRVEKEGADQNAAKENMPMEREAAVKEGDTDMEYLDQSDVEMVDGEMRNIAKENAAPVEAEKQADDRVDGVVGWE